MKMFVTAPPCAAKSFSNQLKRGSSVFSDLSLDIIAVRGAAPLGKRRRIISLQFCGRSSELQSPAPLIPKKPVVKGAGMLNLHVLC